MIRVLIVDDEPLARARIADLLLPWEEVEVIGECECGAEAVTTVLDLRPDLLLLDVQMPGLDGFDVLEALAGEYVPAVIFVTAHDEFALRAFEVHALDYLLKPLNADRFGAAVERALLSLSQVSAKVSSLMSTLAEERPGRIIARLGTRWLRLSQDEVEWVKAASNYLRLGTPHGECLVRGTLTWFLGRTEPGRFLQVHRSIAVHADRVAALESRGNGSYEIRMQSGFVCHSSRGHSDTVLRLKQR